MEIRSRCTAWNLTIINKNQERSFYRQPGRREYEQQTESLFKRFGHDYGTDSADWKIQSDT